MVNYAASKDWRAAFLKSIPTRKGFQKLNRPNNTNSNDNEPNHSETNDNNNNNDSLPP